MAHNSVHSKQYLLEALVIMHEDALVVAYCQQRTPEAMDMILAILGYVTQEAKALALQRKTSVTKGS